MIGNGSIYCYENMMGFGKRLGIEIENLGLNQRQVSMKAGVDYPFINKIINKDQNVTIDTLLKLLPVEELKPFLLKELVDRAPELFTPENLELLGKLQKHTPERILKALKEEQ